MSSRRNSGATETAARLSTTRRSVSPLTVPRSKLSSTEKENITTTTNPRRSTSRGSASNPTQKPTTRPIPRVDRRSSFSSSNPRGRSPSPSDLPQTRRVDRNPIKDPTNQKPHRNPIVTEKAKPRKIKEKESSVRVENSAAVVVVDEKSNKYPSKLHEKLAFLEGKVKRIASDIKKTKEMLDLNNPDASKVILSDLQDKISGIEKAIVHVLPNEDSENSNKKVVVVDSDRVEVEELKQKGLKLNSEELESRLFPHHREVVVVDNDRVEVEELKQKGLKLNSEELEARLFPQHKLLRDRGKDSAIEDNKIADEFLATLDKGRGKVYTCVEIEESDVGGGACDGIGVGGGRGSSGNNQKLDIDKLLAADEKLEEFDEQENKKEEGEGLVGEEIDEAFNFKLNGIGNKAATAGWFVSEGEAVILAHDDASCSYYDIINSEEKAVYMPPPGLSPNIWRDCWVIRAQGSDGCAGRFVVAASAGNTLESGFCSWDFYSKEVKAFQVEFGTTTSSRTALRPLPNSIRRNSAASTLLGTEPRQWWYKPCGPLIVSTATAQRAVKVFDVRDGEQIMKWDVQKSVLAMDYSSPLQWRNRGKVVVAEAESLSLWDVDSLSPQALLSVSSGGRKISALHVSHTDAELGGGVRKRVSSSEAEGHDGVFCTSDSINILDFRQPSGVGLKISKLGVNVQSVFSRGDSLYLGCTSTSSMGKKQSSPLLQQFSLRKQGLFNTYTIPESNVSVHPHHAAISQVWGNSDFVMGVCGLGLYVFDALKDDAVRVLNTEHSNAENVREVVGPDDMYWPSFDYLRSRALLISRDRPAMWRHLVV